MKSELKSDKKLGPYYHQQFESTADMIASVSEANRKVMARHIHGSFDWLGVESPAAVFKAVEDGWPEGLKKMEETLAKLAKPVLVNARRVKAWNGTGDEVEMQRVWSGDLSRAWRRMARADGGRMRNPSSATLLVDVGGHCGRKAEELFWTGACAVAIVKAMRASGRPCKVVAYHLGEKVDKDREYGLLFELTVQEMGRSLSMEKLAATLCLAGFFRVHGFHAICSQPKPAGDGLGCPVHGRMPDGVKHPGKEILLSGVFDRVSAEAFLERELATWK